ncbi:hypothetical protein E1287_08075 [Actinomadura sp. KC06]|uniref:hypothetical protein n=1 Tax=Actinomadura sp. KC06 TaxID=2530369 RepID=UPI001050EA92|nr:hypothetical protein [Actinomadura sp. KC06]TDD37524.1 hypothetical protein E1287_08075 [Actinomadura sp. KC06]
MQYQKLARMVAVPGLALTMAATPAMAATAQATPAKPATQTAAKQTDTAAAAAAVKRMSRKCSKPKGKKLNISFAPGKQSTTFYFNNHCSHKGYIKVRTWTTGKPNYKTTCIRVNAKTKGKKRIWHVGGWWDRTQLVGKC